MILSCHFSLFSIYYSFDFLFAIFGIKNNGGDDEEFAFASEIARFVDICLYHFGDGSMTGYAITTISIKK